MRVFRTSLTLFLLFVAANAAAGKTISVDEFASKIEGSINTVDSAMLRLGELERDEGDLEQYDAELAKLRLLWPSDIQVSDTPTNIGIDSDWIIVELDLLEAEDNIDSSALILAKIRDRFAAMRSALDERRQATAAGPTKDSDKQKLDEILRREEYQKPKAEEGLIARLIRQFFEWLQSRTPSDQNEPAARAGSPILTTLLWIGVIGAALALVFYLLRKFAPFLFGRFAKEGRATVKDRVVLGELIGDDVEASEIFAEAEELARRGELRLAVRKGYIAVLCELSDRKVIGLARHKTNRDYLRDLRNRDSLRRDLGGLTERFERHWYGDQSVAGEEWNEFRDLYRQTVANQN